MKSLRLVLAGWLLALLAGLQAGVGLLAYTNARQVVLEKTATAEELEFNRNEERKHDGAEDLDRRLLDQALTLARLMQVHLDWGRVRYRELNSLGTISLATAPNGFVLFPGWFTTQFRGPLYSEVLRQVPEIRFNRDELTQQLNDVTEYYQVDTVWGSTYRSESLPAGGMAIDLRAFAPEKVLHFEFNDYDLPSGVPVRRVRLKAPSSRLVPTGPGFPPMPGSGRRDRGSGGRGQPTVPNRLPEEMSMPLRPSVFIQCAYPLELREKMMDDFDAKFEEAKGNLYAERDASLRHLAWQLALISTTTFLLGALGTGFLVRWGLKPLRRLSEAVSRVSERDFRLQVNKASLPEELQPIAGRIDGMLGQLERAFVREKQATADISHELRTPLAGMITTLDLALRKERTEQQYREFLTDCKESAGHMARIVEKLLALARLDAGTAVVQSRDVDLAEMAADCLDVVRPLAKAQNIELIQEGDSPCMVRTDPAKFQEALQNLLHNAIQYNRRGGKVFLRQRELPGEVLIEVEDTGIGIPPEAREMIFERFYRHDPARNIDGASAGLGLAIVRSFVLLMGGTITVDSKVGEGTTFRIRLPRTKSAERSAVAGALPALAS
jgi:signal transduction histidine kinase